MTYRRIHQLIYLRHRERIFGTGLIKIREIHTHTLFPSFLFHHYYVSQPLRIKFLLYGSGLFKLEYFPPNNIKMFPK